MEISIVWLFLTSIDTIFPFRLFKLLGFKWIVEGEGIYFKRVETRERIVRVVEQRGIRCGGIDLIINFSLERCQYLFDYFIYFSFI